MRDKSHNDQIERWAEYIRNTPKKAWKKGFNEFIDAQCDMAQKFNNNLKKTEKGREILKRLKEERSRQKS